MQSKWRVMRLVGKPVGVSLLNGQGASGVLCGVEDGTVLLIEYLYQETFALKQYPLRDVRDILPFPGCRSLLKEGGKSRRVY